MKWIKKHKVFVGIMLVLLLLIGGVFGYVWSKLSLIQYETGDTMQTVPQQTESDASQPTEEKPTEDDREDVLSDEEMENLPTVETEPPIPESEVWGDKDTVNILLLGTDEHSEYFSEASRSDSMILVSINKADKTVKLVSLQRGMGVPVLEGEHKGKYDWLTHMFRYGGAELTRKTVETCFRIEVDHYVRVNLNSVKQIVDIVGGVDIDMTAAEAHFFTTKLLSPKKEGINHLKGSDAVLFARLRAIDSDFSRVVRQRRIIDAIVSKLKDSDLATLDKLANQVLPYIATNMSKLEIMELILYAPTFLNSEFEQMTLPADGTYGGMVGMGGRNLYAVDFETNSEILKEFLYGETE